MSQGQKRIVLKVVPKSSQQEFQEKYIDVDSSIALGDFFLAAPVRTIQQLSYEDLKKPVSAWSIQIVRLDPEVPLYDLPDWPLPSLPALESVSTRKARNWSLITIPAEYINAASKSSIWIISTLLFGLLQFWILLIPSFIKPELELLNNKKILLDGSLLFFVSAVVVGLSVDYFLSDNSQGSLPKPENLRFEIFIIYIIFPTLIVLACISLFFGCSSFISANINGAAACSEKPEFIRARDLEYVIFTMALLYCFFVKLFSFLKDGEAK